MADPFPVYKSRADLERLLAEGLVESLQIEFKSSLALSSEGKKPDELCINVSAMANSAGGQIFFCVDEAKKTGGPVRVDEGVRDPKVTREWIEQILISRVHPRMNGIRIDEVDLGNSQRGYVLSVPQTSSGPHQAPDHRYYKRFQLAARAMEDYEVRDVARRSTTPQPYVSLAFATGRQQQLRFSDGSDTSDAFYIVTSISNRSPAPANHAVINIGFDIDFLLFSQGNFDSMGSFPDSSGITMKWYQRIISSPPMLPIFKEHTMPLAPHHLQFSINTLALRSSPVLDITVQVSAPGFSSEEHWALNMRGSTIYLHPPGTEMTDRSKG